LKKLTNKNLFVIKNQYEFIKVSTEIYETVMYAFDYLEKSLYDTKNLERE
jgi:hypothetical protein